ncbi:ribosomal protein l30 [Malassezia pachydermatis]|uniref:Large ribosomal subunit protein uL30m n=1 Tax=Malassezia pachydermatis TaxID=77020 RepID=A0A0M8MSN5_9BASI|nr:ribosomal protein l30 [Malassezia pachydermatis]KOS13000.1 ribosomal protein l30 [Malassezia pachydermatis]
MLGSSSRLIRGALTRSLRSYSTASSSQGQGPTTHYRITLRRSTIGLPERTSRIVEALGLHKRLQSVFHRQTPTTAGMILAVKELVHVENVRLLQPAGDESASPIWVNANGEVVDAGRISRKAPRGFKIVGNLIDETRDQELRKTNA